MYNRYLRPMYPPIQKSPPSGLLAGRSLFLDFDGTLVDIAPAPDLIAPDRDLTLLLQQLSGMLKGRLAIVSGRSVVDISAWLPGYGGAIAGSHGAEFRWPDGRLEGPERPQALDAALAAARDFADLLDGVSIEDKSLGIGLHFRSFPHHAQAVEDFAAGLARVYGLALQKGKMVVELRTSGFDKGTAIRLLMDQPPFRDGPPVFVGDDLTDIPAMQVASELGGFAIVVGDLDYNAAEYRLASVAQTLEWLKQECMP